MAADGARFALLTNGSDFSLAVIEALCRRHRRPELIAVPEYPPAAASVPGGLARVDQTAVNAALKALPSSRQFYLPAARQLDIIDEFERLRIEYLLVACWPYLIDARLVEHLQGKAVNLHPSLLPGYRGANPITRQLSEQAEKFGVSLHLLSPVFDRGDIVSQKQLEIGAVNRNERALERACAESGVDLFLQALERGRQNWHLQPQR